MEMEGSRVLAITQDQAWAALNDPEVLKASIPGCEKVEATGENRYAVVVAVKVGPLAAKFAGKIALSDVNPPESYTLSFDGQGGAAGFGKGQAKVKLTPQGSACELAYSATAQVGGKLAQVGQRLIDGVARSMAEDFFKRFDQEVQRRYPQAYADAAAAAAETQPAGGSQSTREPPARGVPPWMWIAGAMLVVALVWWFKR
jgi:carbon monoxide dehydrogenase subunit G